MQVIRKIVPFAWALALALPAIATAEEKAPAGEGEPEVHIRSERELEDDGYVLRLSLPTQADVDAWAEPGFRVQLGYFLGAMAGHAHAASFATNSFALRPVVRLDERWSVAATFGYSVATSGVSGIRWSATLEPMFHPWKGLGLSMGLGYGGLDAYRVSKPGESGFVGEGTTEIVSRTLDDDERLRWCEGSAWASLARAEYLFVVGPLFSTGPFVQADLQFTRCEQRLGTNDLETGLPIVGRQWWRNQGASVGWWASWR